MGEVTHSIRPIRSRYIADEPLPAIVEVDFIDAAGAQWTVSDKTSVFSRSTWTHASGSPDDVGIDCFVTKELDSEQVEIELAWGCESTTGERSFTMNRNDLMLSEKNERG